MKQTLGQTFYRKQLACPFAQQFARPLKSRFIFFFLKIWAVGEKKSISFFSNTVLLYDRWFDCYFQFSVEEPWTF